MSSSRRACRVMLAWGLWLMWGAVAAGSEPYLTFASGLRQRGYGDMAVAYLKQIEQRSDTPPRIREVLNLELSISYQVLSQQTKSPELAEQWRVESRRLFAEFSSAHPKHPAIPQALLELGAIAFERGQRIVTRGKSLPANEVRATSYREARAALNDARPQLEQSAELFKQQLSVLSVESALPLESSTNRSAGNEVQDAVRDAEIGLVESKLKLAGIHYYLSQTYPDSKAPERIANLTSAIKEFEWVYRRCRDSEVGLRAQLWQARVTEELGDLPAAIELYDEVLASEMDATGTPEELAAVFGQAALYRLRLIPEVSGDETARNESADWLRKHKTWNGTAFYQGIALESAKALLRRAKNETPKIKEKFTGEALSLLAGVAVVPGEFQNDAIRLRREHLDLKSDAAAPPRDDPRALGDAAAEAGRWKEAVTAYESALDLARKNADAKALTTSSHRLNLARYHLSVNQFTAGKMADAIQTAAAVAKSGAKEPHAAEAASLTCFAALALCESAAANDGASAYSRLQRITEFTLKTWPGQPPADDAQIVLGQFEAKRGELERAVEYFEKVETTSPRFASAALGAARAYWRLYLGEKRKTDEVRDNNLLNQWRVKAETKLQAAVDQTSSSSVEHSSPLQSSECRIFLAEIILESNQFKEALAVIQPVFAQYPLTGQPGERESLAVRTHIVGLRAHTALGELEQAITHAQVIAHKGPDAPHVNAALLEFMRVARREFGESRSVVDGAKGTLEQVALSATQDHMLKLKEPLQQVASKLAARQQPSIQSLAFIADTCRDLGMVPEARDVCERILRQSASDPQTETKNANLVTKVRLLLVNLLYDQGQFEDAAREIELLVSAHPNSLELLIKKGEILQSWAAKDDKRLGECAAHWSNVRVFAARVRPRPKEYYQIVHHAAFCLIEQASSTGDPNYARQAEQLLKSTLALHPALDGPEMVARFKLLLTRVELARQKSK